MNTHTRTHTHTRRLWFKTSIPIQPVVLKCILGNQRRQEPGDWRSTGGEQRGGESQYRGRSGQGSGETGEETWRRERAGRWKTGRTRTEEQHWCQTTVGLGPVESGLGGLDTVNVWRLRLTATLVIRAANYPCERRECDLCWSAAWGFNSWGCWFFGCFLNVGSRKPFTNWLGLFTQCCEARDEWVL